MTAGDRAELLRLLSAYCDDRLDGPGLDRLEAVLTADRAARRVYAEFLDVHARMVARGGVAVPKPKLPVNRWAWAIGLVATAAMVWLAVRPAASTGPAGVVSDRSGPVQVSPDGRMVATLGVTASAVVTYPGGASVTLGGDTVAEIADGPTPKLSVRKGAVAATVPKSSAPMVVATEAATAVIASGSRLIVDAGRAEFGVRTGSVRVTSPDDRPQTDMGEGEMCTVGPDVTSKRPLTDAPEEYAWEASRPLPAGWEAGRIAPGPSLRPERWFDKYAGINRKVWQLRSDNQWLRGLFTYHPDARWTLRYRLARPDATGMPQVVFVVRPDPIERTKAVILNWQGLFRHAPPGEWHTIDRRLGDLPMECHSGWVPAADARLVVFQTILNLFDDDLGLEVAEFRVYRPNAP